MPRKVKLSPKPENSVRATLERIKAESVAEFRRVIADRREKSMSVDAVAALLEKVVSGPAVAALLEKAVSGPAHAVSSASASRVVQEFLAAFQSHLGRYSESVFAKAADWEVYPDGCRLLIDGETGGIMVIEQTPQVRTLLVSARKYHVPLPYVVFVLHFARYSGMCHHSGAYVGFSRKPIKSINDKLLIPPLPNFSGHRVCMGSYLGMSGTFSTLAADFIGNFWQGEFHESYPNFKVGGQVVQTWKQWEAIKPLDMLRADLGAGNTIKQLAGNHSDDNYSNFRKSFRPLIDGTWNQTRGDIDVSAAKKLLQANVRDALKLILRELLTLQTRKS